MNTRYIYIVYVYIYVYIYIYIYIYIYNICIHICIHIHISYMYTYMNMRFICISFLRGSYRYVCVFISGEFALPPMDGPRVVRAEAVGDRWKDLLLSVSLPHS